MDLDRQELPPPRANEPPQRVPELRPPLLGDWFIYLSLIVLVCGTIAITAIELGTPLEAPLVKWLSVIAAAVLLLVTADATTVAPLSFEQLVDASASVVYGRVVDVRSQWTDDRRFIESVVSVEVITDMKGGARDRISFTTPGGQVGRYLNVIPGAPVFAPGDTAVFFLTSRGPRLPGG